MREIKFRGIGKENKQWVFGYFSISAYCSEGTDFTIHPDVRTSIRIEENTLGQFTGLYDKNGNEIYEGDIIKGETRNFTVKFEEGMFTTDVGKYILNGDYEIIGNIHQNPELLESSAKADA